MRVDSGLTPRPVSMEWQASRDGHVEVIEKSVASRLPNEGKEVKRRDVAITVAQFDALRAMVASVHEASKRPARCRVTDGPMITVEYEAAAGGWRWASSNGCEEAYQTAWKATALLRRWTNSRPK